MPTPDEVPTLDLGGGAAARRVGWGFISLYALAFISTSLVFLAPLLVSLALKVNSLVGIEQAPNSLSVVTGIGSLLAIVGNPFFGRMSDRTSSRLGMRRPWMVIGLVGGSLGILVVALAPSIPVVLIGWCIAQLLFNALLAALVAVLPDQVPVTQRGLVAGVLGICVPVASVSGTFLVDLFTGNLLAMFMVPCAVGGSSSCSSRSGWTTAGLPGRTGRPGPCGSSPAPSTSTRARARTSPGRSPAASCSSWPTPS
jgi:MFS family permease